MRSDSAIKKIQKKKRSNPRKINTTVCIAPKVHEDATKILKLFEISLSAYIQVRLEELIETNKNLLKKEGGLEKK